VQGVAGAGNGDDEVAVGSRNSPHAVPRSRFHRTAGEHDAGRGDEQLAADRRVRERWVRPITRHRR
jgi:hypothetical protein